MVLLLLGYGKWRGSEIPRRGEPVGSGAMMMQLLNGTTVMLDQNDF